MYTCKDIFDRTRFYKQEYFLKRVQDDTCHAGLVAASGNGEAVSASINETGVITSLLEPA
jgi:hypothetical protein